MATEGAHKFPVLERYIRFIVLIGLGHTAQGIRRRAYGARRCTFGGDRFEVGGTLRFRFVKFVEIVMGVPVKYAALLLHKFHGINLKRWVGFISFGDGETPSKWVSKGGMVF